MLALALCACNGLLGLDGAVPDSDRDGVADAIDNCPFDANPQQRDSDGNGLGDVCDCAAAGVDLDADGVDDACDDCVGVATGEDVGGDGVDDGCEVCAEAIGVDMDADGVDDACDPCPLGSAHDEDGDGVADACDNCPTQPNPEQQSMPGAALGDACAQGGLQLTRFDPFVEQDPTLWPGIVPGWTWIDDGVEISGAVSRSTTAVVAAEFMMETRWTTKATVALECRSGGTRRTACTLDAMRQLTLSSISFRGVPSSVTTASIPGTEAIRIRFRAVTSGTMCEAIDAKGAVIEAAEVPEHALCPTVKVVTTGDSHLDYLWLVTK